jgi:phosphoglycerate dehydrogenase-like enzyme
VFSGAQFSGDAIFEETEFSKLAYFNGAHFFGAAVGERVSAFDAAATLVAKTARDGVHAAGDLPELISNRDIVVITAPLTDATEGLVDATFLAARPANSVLVNAARGRIVDTSALVAELRAERIRAALDVTDPEPLPAGRPLWTRPGVIISPHMARTVPGTPALCYSVAVEQVAMLVGGQTPSNLVTERRN